MERHIGTWEKEYGEEKTEVGELIIDGNYIEFYSRFGTSIFPENFVGNDGNHNYKVFTSGMAVPGNNRVLDHTSSYNVRYVLMHNGSFPVEDDITGIKEFSFTIPELVEWIGLPLVSFSNTTGNKLAAEEIELGSIIIKESDPKVELYTESKSFNSLNLQDNTTITLKREPRIRVVYEKTVDESVLSKDIECIMQFLGLLIGKVSYASDIRLSIEGQDLKSWLYINRDFSYNCKMWDVMSKPRTYLYVIEDEIVQLFYNWRKFFYDDHFSLLRSIYFSINNSREKYLEDVFVEYMRILDGYHTRIARDDETKARIKQALKNASKEIKKQLFTEDNKPIFEESIKQVLPDWKYNSSNIGDISTWIASGYLGKKSLSYRLKELDMNYHIMQNGAERIIGQYGRLEIPDKVEEIYYKELGDTRNYYSHYKSNNDGVLDFNQMNDSIKVLKATIISIFFTHMKMESELIRKILAFDTELIMQTSFLRLDEEQPFLHPMEQLKKLKEDCADNIKMQ